MKSLIFLFTVAILVQSVFIAGAPADDKVHPELSRQMALSLSNNSQDTIRVIVIMKEQYHPLEVKVKVKAKSKEDKKQQRQETTNALKEQSQQNQQSINAALKGKEPEKVKNIEPLWIVNAIGLEATPDVIEELARRDDVTQVIPDFEVHLLDEPAAQEQISTESIAWGVEKINAPDVWAQYNGTGINVSIVDSGIYDEHLDLDDLDDNVSTDDPKVIKWKDYIGSSITPYDDNGHGTHVAGTVSGTGAGGTKTGVAPGTNLFGAKIFDSGGSGYTLDVIDAFQWSINNDADIISYSGGSSSHNDSWTTMIDNTIAAGVLPVIAAGNDGDLGPSHINCPGDEKNATTVGATDINDDITYFSSLGPVTLYGDTYIKPDLVAPGYSILSARVPGISYPSLNIYNDYYVYMSGTSMATPHVSGAAALILQAYPDMPPLEVRQLLEDTAVDLGTAGKDNTFGSGRIDVLKAILPQVSNITITPDPTNINSTINATMNDARYNISYADLYIDADTTNATLLAAVDNNFNETSENVTGIIDITNLSDGIHMVTIRTNNSLDIWNNQTKTSFTVDTTEPNITLHSPDNDSSIQNGTIINFTITDLTLANVTYSINSTQQGYTNKTNVTFPHPYEINTADWNESTYVIRIWANDSLGHENSSNYRFTINDTPPIITGVSHNASGILDYGDVLGINMTGDPGISNATFDINGLVYDKPMDETTPGNYSGNYTVSGTLEIENAIVTGHLTDEAGNTNSSDAPTTISIDTDKPRLSLLSPANNSYIQNGSIIDLTIIDLFLANVTYNYSGTDLSLLSPFDIDTTGWNEGQYDIIIWANDSLNHISSAIYNITIDDTTPNLTIISPTSGYRTTGSTVNISGTTDEDAELTINSEFVTLTDGSFSEDRSIVDGENNFIINATDQAGNINSVLRTVTKYTTSSTTSSSSGGGGGGGTSGEDFNNIAETQTKRNSIFKNEAVSYAFEQTLNPIIYVNFTSKISAGTIASKIEVLRNTSTLANISAPGLVYKNINIWVGNYGWASDRSIVDATIIFVVPREWITTQNIHEDSITLYRYNNDSWEQLPTSMLNNNEQYLYYQSLTPGFSPFAISGDLVLVPAPTPAPTPTPTVIRTPVPRPAENTSIALNDEISVEPEPDGWNAPLWALLTIVVLSLIAIVYVNQDGIHKVIDNIKQRGRR